MHWSTKCFDRIAVYFLSLIVVFFINLSAAMAGSTPATIGYIEDHLNNVEKRNSVLSPMRQILDLLDEANATKKEASRILRRWRKLQNPSISKEQLREIYQTKQQAIKDIDIEFIKNAQEPISDGRLVTVKSEQTIRLAMAGDKIYRRASAKSEGNDTEKTATYSFDGEYLREYRTGDNPYNHGIISELRSRSVFYESISPLAATMLLDSTKEGKHVNQLHDFTAFLRDENNSWVMQETHMINDAQTVVVAYGGPPATFLVYVDPERDYAVLRVESYRLELNKNGVPTSIIQKHVTNNHDLIDMGQGIWLPQNVTYTFYNRGEEGAEKTQLRRQVSVQLIKSSVNKGIPGKFFTDLFPLGTQMWDQINDMTYYYSHGDEIVPSLDTLVNKGRSLTIEQQAVSAANLQIEKTTLVAESLESPGNSGVTTLNDKSSYFWLVWLVIGIISGFCYLAIRTKRKVDILKE